MPIINKFGLTQSKSRQDLSEHVISKTIERVLRRNTFITLNQDDDDEYEVGGRRIANVGNPVAEADGANKRFVEAVVWSAFDQYPKENVDVKNHRIENVASPVDDKDAANKGFVDYTVRSAFESFPETDFDVRQNRITNLRMPVYENDAVSKKYVDKRFLQNVSIFLINLRADESDWYVIEPYGTHEYTFPFNVDVKLNNSDLTPSEVDVMNDDSILGTVFEGAFHSFAKGSRLSFRRLGDKDKAYVELVYHPTA